jgi:hypothetical protein
MVTEDQYIALARSKYQELKELEKAKDFYEFEKRFDEIWTELGRQVIEQHISDVPNDRRKKNFM